MFRRKDAENGRSLDSPEAPFPRVLNEPRAPQSELPRRTLESPTVPSPSPAPVPGPTGADRSISERSPETMEQSEPVPEKKQLIVGHGISLAGEITACDKLMVLGSVQVTLNQTRAIEIAETGRFTNGKAEVEEAEISGLYEGDLTVKRRLFIRSTGQVKGNVRYGEIEIERGGRLEGSVNMLGSSAADPRPTHEPKPAAA